MAMTDSSMKKDTTHLEHVEDPKDRINVSFAQNINAKYVLPLAHRLTLTN